MFVSNKLVDPSHILGVVFPIHEEDKISFRAITLEEMYQAYWYSFLAFGEHYLLWLPSLPLSGRLLRWYLTISHVLLDVLFELCRVHVLQFVDSKIVTWFYRGMLRGVWHMPWCCRTFFTVLRSTPAQLSGVSILFYKVHKYQCP